MNNSTTGCLKPLSPNEKKIGFVWVSVCVNVRVCISSIIMSLMFLRRSSQKSLPVVTLETCTCLLQH
jgi:hypothetical protein